MFAFYSHLIPVFTLSTDYPPHLQKILTELDALSTKELRQVNRYIVDRSKARSAQSTKEAMAQFTPGDPVSFNDKQGIKQHGIVLKINKKTVGVADIEGDRWNISPELLTLSTPTKKQDGPADHVATASVSALPTSQKTSAEKKSREWVGGTITVPGFITGEPGENYRPLMPVWLNEFQQVVGMSLMAPDDQKFDAVSSLNEAISNPSVGLPGAPTHIRVSDSNVAEQLQRAFTSIAVSVGPTPELDEVAEAMADDFGGDSSPQLYSDIADSNHSVSDFFESTAALYKAAPWKIVPHDECIIGITAKSLGISDGALCIIGQQQESFGVLLFESLNDYERYRLLVNAMQNGDMETIPAHRILAFDNANDIAPEIRKDIVRHKWKVAAPNAYPNVMCPHDDRMLRPITENDIELFDVIARTLPAALRNTQFVKALNGNGNEEFDTQILTKNQPVSITLQAPYPYQRILKEQGAKDDLIAALLLLERTATDAPDWDRHDVITAKLLKRYHASAEGKASGSEFGSASLIMSMAFNYCSCTIASITPSVLDEILFSIIPSKVMIQAEDAADIIDDCRAFLQFLINEYKLERARECLTRLDADDNPVHRLADALRNPGNFGIGKSIFSSNDPFPMNSPPDLLPKLSATKPKPADKKSRKKKRSASRKARKKNR